MVVKGYKQTEVGVIPDDWGITKLGDVIDKDRIIRYGIVQPGKYELGGCLMLRSQDYSKGWQGPDEMHRVNSLIEAQYKNARLSEGDQVMTVVGAGIGQIVTVPNWLNGAIASRSTARIGIDKTKASSEFVKSCLISPIGKRQILDCQKEGAQPVVSCRDLANFKIPMPSLSEQTAIATALSDTDALINSLEKLIAKKRNVKQGAMQELFGAIGKDNLMPVSDLTRFHKQGYYTQETYKPNGKYYLLRGTDMQNPEIDLSTTPKIDSNEKDFLSYKVEVGDFLFVRSGAIGRYGIVKNKIDAIFGSYLINFRFNTDKLLNEFFGYFYESEFASQQLASITQGSSNININAENIKSLEIPLPTKKEQNRIVVTLSAMDSEITALESKLSKYRQIKSGMMQNLLTGKIRLV